MRGSKRTLQGTASSTPKVSVSCLLANLILPQGSFSMLVSVVMPVTEVNSLKSRCFHFTFLIPACPSHQVSSFLIPLNPPPAICSHFFPHPFKCLNSSKPWSLPLSIPVLLHRSALYRSLPSEPSPLPPPFTPVTPALFIRPSPLAPPTPPSPSSCPIPPICSSPPQRECRHFHSNKELSGLRKNSVPIYSRQC